MAFKELQPQSSAPESPEQLFLELPRRKIPNATPHQKQTMCSYASSATADSAAVALQLPTGSGKTLVGLLIGEWRRRKNNERVVYLCPTRQLVHQVVEQANNKYGLSVYCFTGKIQDYDSGAKFGYQNAERIAVTTYSSLFNTNPYFRNADVLILDDVHTAESYVADCWSLRVSSTGYFAELYSALCQVLRSCITPRDYARLCGNSRDRIANQKWVEKVPTPFLLDHVDEIVDLVNQQVINTSLSYPWSMIRNHLHACHIYLSTGEILIRPLVSPTWTHPPFTEPKQRIYMSATLGKGGDLERLVGRRRINRLATPNSWDRYGAGRRFFIFPGISIETKEFPKFRQSLMSLARRSLVLVPSDKMQSEIVSEIGANLDFTIFRADDIEQSKKEFVNEPNAVAVMANRYDGIDFPGDECRLLFIEGLPKATNLQEYFLMTRMGANILFNERVQVRVLQAIGRCTRSLEDYSAVIVSGPELTDYLADIRRQKYLHPELQAEISFGIKQSEEMTVEELIENFKIFLENGEDWENANHQIVSYRASVSQENFPSLEQLNDIVKEEIKFHECLWQEDYESALTHATSVLGGLQEPALRGYRALWHYLAGTAATLATEAGHSKLVNRARQEYVEAKKAATGIPWLVKLSGRVDKKIDEKLQSEKSSSVLEQLERLEHLLMDFGCTSHTQFSSYVNQINQGLQSTNNNFFEKSHEMVGELLGYETGNAESEGAPDPWWLSGDVCIVFEDNAAASLNSSISVTKARQVYSHPNWIRSNVALRDDTTIQAVLVTPAKTTSSAALVHLNNVAIWDLEEFKGWTLQAISIIRELRTDFIEPGNLEWRAQAVTRFEQNQLDAPGLLTMLSSRLASDILQID